MVKKVPEGDMARVISSFPIQGSQGFRGFGFQSAQ